MYVRAKYIKIGVAPFCFYFPASVLHGHDTRLISGYSIKSLLSSDVMRLGHDYCLKPSCSVYRGTYAYADRYVKCYVT